MKKVIIQEEKETSLISKALENKRKSGLLFSHVFITKIVKNKAYVAKFNFRFENNNILNPMETSINGKSPEECITKTEKFLGTKLNDSEYSLPKVKFSY